ncbi:MAG: lipid A biosynthesis lauroyl acyltransferase [Campylobacterota bacterium]|nr:lipid A biosynthesis lauroyl acyltransferase [Campylobacterota bacterium]
MIELNYITNQSHREKMDYFLFLIYKTFKFIVLRLPKFLVKYFLDFITFVIYTIDRKHRRFGMANLDFVYKDTLTKKRKEEILKNSYTNMVYNLYEFIENPTLNLEQIEKKVTLKNEHIITDAIKENKKIILISAHYGNWELITSYISMKYKPTTMVGRKMENHYFNDDMEKNRKKHNSQMLPKKGSAKGLIKALRDDRILGLAIDQHIQLKRGIEINFLGYRASMVDSTSRIALKTGAVIIPVYFIKDGFGKYTIDFKDPLSVENLTSEDKVKELTQLQADSMSEQILKKPDDWMWVHRRFKAFYSEIYN